MNWQRWWRSLCGWVRFEAEGGFPGRLLTLAAQNGIPLWDTHRDGTFFSACCPARMYRQLRPLARRCGLRLHLKERHGAVFTLRKYHARPGLLAGVAVYFMLLSFFSGRIWALDLRGWQYADQAALKTLLAEHGVAVGASKRGVDSEAIRLDAFSRLPDISWLAVNLDGCVAEVEIQEKNPHETPMQPDAPSNLVAARDGLVVAVEITGGTATVQVGDAVAKGGMLANGVISTGQETLLRRSSGQVLAQTKRDIVVTVPLEEALPLPAGPAAETLTLHFFGWQLPFYDNAIPTENCRIDTAETFLTAGEIALPIGLSVKRYTPLSVQTLHRTPEEAKRLAEQRLQSEETAQLEQVEVLKRTVTQEQTKHAVTLRATYCCVENIAVEVPLQIETLSSIGYL